NNLFLVLTSLEQNTERSSLQNKPCFPGGLAVKFDQDAVAEISDGKQYVVVGTMFVVNSLKHILEVGTKFILEVVFQVMQLFLQLFVFRIAVIERCKFHSFLYEHLKCIIDGISVHSLIFCPNIE